MIQEQVKALIDSAVESGTETGVQVAVFVDGSPVVDAVAGVVDPITRRPVSGETLFFAGSAAKGIASAVAHTLIAQGYLHEDLPLVEVWPEFAADGKSGVRLWHVLCHTAGVPAPPYETTIEDLCDWDRMCAAIANAHPWWKPGTEFGYHAVTYGFLLGETVRRATGQTLPWWLHELITGPLGIEDDVHFGVPSRLLARVATQAAHPDTALPSPEAGSPADRAIPPAIRPDASYANRSDVLMADIPSQGTMTAGGAARVYAALVGQVPDIELVNPARCERMARLTHRGRDSVMGVESEWALGFSPHRPASEHQHTGSTFGMFGLNGTGAYADIDSGVAVALMRNRFNPDSRLLLEVDRIVAETYPPHSHSRQRHDEGVRR
jgi:CubicO group peptidase (beta-lactamase class C family)